MERIPADRASICGVIVNRSDDRLHAAGEIRLARSDSQQRKIKKAHAWFLSAVRTLPQFRQPPVPAPRVNIARYQANEADALS
jgi:hypothetical protein